MPRSGAPLAHSWLPYCLAAAGVGTAAGVLVWRRAHPDLWFGGLLRPGGGHAHDHVVHVSDSLQLNYPASVPLLKVLLPLEPQAVNLPSRVALLVERHCARLLDFTGERGDSLALDAGCAAGGVSLELTKLFQAVLGLDWRPELLAAAREMATRGAVVADRPRTGRLCYEPPEDALPDRAVFVQVVGAALPPNLPRADALILNAATGGEDVLTAHADALLRLLAPDGVCVAVCSSRGGKEVEGMGGARAPCVRVLAGALSCVCAEQCWCLHEGSEDDLTFVRLWLTVWKL